MDIKAEKTQPVAEFTSDNSINWKDKDYADFLSLVRSMRKAQNEFSTVENMERVRSLEQAVDLKIAEMQSPEANK